MKVGPVGQIYKSSSCGQMKISSLSSIMFFSYPVFVESVTKVLPNLFTLPAKSHMSEHDLSRTLT